MLVGQIGVKLSADLSEYRRKLGEAERMAHTTGGVLKSALGTAVGFGLAQVGIASLGAAFRATISAGIQFNATMETSRVALTSMLRSAEDADRVIRALWDYAATTPFEFPGLQQATKLLISYRFSAEEAISVIKTLGDASAAMGMGTEGINRLALAIGQMQAKTKVTGEEMRQLSEMGIPAWDMLAKATGRTTAEVMKLSEKGLIPAEQAIRVLLAGMEEQFGGASGRLSKTLAGQWTTLLDAMRESFGRATKPLTDWLTNQGLPAMTEAVKTFGTVAGSAFQFAAKHADGLKAAILGVSVALVSLKASALVTGGAMTATFGKLAGVLGVAAGAGYLFYKSVDKTPKGLETLDERRGLGLNRSGRSAEIEAGRRPLAKSVAPSRAEGKEAIDGINQAKAEAEKAAQALRKALDAAVGAPGGSKARAPMRSGGVDYSALVADEVRLWKARYDAETIGVEQYLAILDKFARDSKLKEIDRLGYLQEANAIREELREREIAEVTRQEEARAEANKRAFDMIRATKEAEISLGRKVMEHEIELEKRKLDHAEATGETSRVDRLKREIALEEQAYALRLESLNRWAETQRELYAEETRLGLKHSVDLLEAERRSAEERLEIAQDYATRKLELTQQLQREEQRLEIEARNRIAEADRAVGDLRLTIGERLADAFARAGAYGDSFGDSMRRLAQDIAYTVAKAFLLRAILGSLGLAGGAFGGVLGLALPGYHSGGVVGFDAPTFYRRLPRYHSGGLVGSDEEIAILQRGERVLSREQNRAYEQGAGGVTQVYVTIKAFDAKSVQDVFMEQSGTIESIIVNRIFRNGAIRSALQRV